MRSAIMISILCAGCVTASNTAAPTAVTDAVTTDRTRAVQVDALANDYDADGRIVAVTSWTDGAFGTVHYEGEGTFTYEPEGYVPSGVDAFTYSIVDDDGRAAEGRVEVTIAPSWSAGIVHGIHTDDVVHESHDGLTLLWSRTDGGVETRSFDRETKQWGEVARLHDGLAIDLHLGHDVAAWQEWDNGSWSVWVSHIEDGEWTTPVAVESSAAYPPSVTTVGSVVVWDRLEGSRYNLWSYLRGSIARLETEDSGDADGGSVRGHADAEGNVTVVWRQSDGVSYTIWGNRFSANGWAGARRIENGDTEDSTTPKLAARTDGGLVALWRHSGELRAAVMDPSGTWSTDTSLSSGATVGAFQAADTTALWLQYDGYGYELRAATFVNDTWSSSVAVDAGVDRFTAVTDETGNVLVTWEKVEGGFPNPVTHNQWASSYHLNRGWSTPTRLEYEDASVDGAQLVQLPQGGALAMWRQGETWTAWADANGSWSPGEPLSASTAMSAVTPTVDENGRVRLVWVTDDGRVCERHFEADTASWSEETELPLGLIGQPTVLGLFADDDGAPTVLGNTYDGIGYAVWTADYR